MLGHCKLLLGQGRVYIVINPVFDQLITSPRIAVAEENILDKDSTSYADIFDTFRLALKHYQLATGEEEDISIVVRYRIIHRHNRNLLYLLYLLH
jgi:hypothetical protein